MIYKKTTLLLLASVAFLSVGCESTSTYSSRTIRTSEVSDLIFSAPLILEYDTVYSTVITDTSSFKSLADQGGVNISSMRKAAVANCCAKHGFDILVNVSYHIFTINSNYYIVVSGLPAKFKRIRPATKDDLWMLEFINNK